MPDRTVRPASRTVTSGGHFVEGKEGAQTLKGKNGTGIRDQKKGRRYLEVRKRKEKEKKKAVPGWRGGAAVEGPSFIRRMRVSPHLVSCRGPKCCPKRPYLVAIFVSIGLRAGRGLLQAP